MKNNGKSNVIDDIRIQIRSAKTLKDILTIKNISLPDGFAYKVAENIKDIKTSQLRKFFDAAKEAKKEENFNNSRNMLYLLVPQVAYSVGRKLCDKKFYELIKECIEPSKLQTKEDINAFVDFFEAIIAYFKVKEAFKGRR